MSSNLLLSHSAYRCVPMRIKHFIYGLILDRVNMDMKNMTLSAKDIKK